MSRKMIDVIWMLAFSLQALFVIGCGGRTNLVKGLLISPPKRVSDSHRYRLLLIVMLWTSPEKVDTQLS